MTEDLVRVRYPRTRHLPWSPGASPDDLHALDVSGFAGREVVVTEKLDGECTTLYCDGRHHARSPSSEGNESRSWVARVAARLSGEVPVGWRLVGENTQAVHSIRYDRLPAISEYFFLFGVFNAADVGLAWSEVEEWAEILDLVTVPVLYRGPWDEKAVRACWSGRSRYGDDQEGYVVRVADEILPEDWDRSIAKFVRPNHVTTDRHWRLGPLDENAFAGEVRS